MHIISAYVYAVVQNLANRKKYVFPSESSLSNYEDNLR